MSNYGPIDAQINNSILLNENILSWTRRLHQGFFIIQIWIWCGVLGWRRFLAFWFMPEFVNRGFSRVFQSVSVVVFCIVGRVDKQSLFVDVLALGPSISFQSWRLKWWLVAHWQPPNGSHPHKLQHYKSILYIKSNTKYWLKNIGNPQMAPIHTNFNSTKVFSLLSQTQNINFKILATSKWLPSTQTSTVQQYSLY